MKGGPDYFPPAGGTAISARLHGRSEWKARHLSFVDAPTTPFTPNRVKWWISKYNTIRRFLDVENQVDLINESRKMIQPHKIDNNYLERAATFVPHMDSMSLSHRLSMFVSLEPVYCTIGGIEYGKVGQSV